MFRRSSFSPKSFSAKSWRFDETPQLPQPQPSGGLPARRRRRRRDTDDDVLLFLIAK